MSIRRAPKGSPPLAFCNGSVRQIQQDPPRPPRRDGLLVYPQSDLFRLEEGPKLFYLATRHSWMREISPLLYDHRNSLGTLSSYNRVGGGVLLFRVQRSREATPRHNAAGTDQPTRIAGCQRLRSIELAVFCMRQWLKAANNVNASYYSSRACGRFRRSLHHP